VPCVRNPLLSSGRHPSHSAGANVAPSFHSGVNSRGADAALRLASVAKIPIKRLPASQDISLARSPIYFFSSRAGSPAFLLESLDEAWPSLLFPRSSFCDCGRQIPRSSSPDSFHIPRSFCHSEDLFSDPLQYPLPFFLFPEASAPP